MSIKHWISLLLIGLLAACASRAPIGPLASTQGPTSRVEVIPGTQLPPGDSEAPLSVSGPYMIAAFDKLEIGVFGIEALQMREYRVDSEGRMSFPLIGTVIAGGLTPAQLEAAIEKRLRADFVRDPQVTVNLKEAMNRNVTVAGNVEKPGEYPVLGRTTLIRAIATAGGMDDFAKTDEVVVFRTVGGRRLAAIYDLRGIQRGNYDDPEIYPHDVVVVGDSPQRRLLRDLLGTAPAILAPLLVTLL